MKFLTTFRSALIILGFIFLLHTKTQGADRYAVASGNWTDNIWSSISGGAVGASTPTSSDNVIVMQGMSVVVNVNSQCASLLLNKDGSGTNYAIIISGSNTLTVLGNTTMAGSGSGTSTLKVGVGTLIIEGNLRLEAPPGYAEVNVSTGGNVFVKGNVDGGSGDSARNAVQGTGNLYVVGVINNATILVAPSIIAQENYLGHTPFSYYQSKNSGSWETIANWETSLTNAAPWTPAATAPGSAASGILIQSVHAMTIASSTQIKNLTVNGLLDCSTFQIKGPGPFILSSGATIITAHANGLGTDGAIKTDGTETYDSGANYEFSGAVTGAFSTTASTVLIPATVKDLTISGSTVTISQALAVSGRVTLGTNSTLVSGGKLTLLSTASSFANVAAINYPISSITGNVNVQSYFSGGYRTARLISPPINDLTTTSVYKQLQTYVYVTGTGTGMDAGTKSLGIYDETRLQTDPFVYVTNIDNKATPGVGFQLVYKGDRNSAATTPGAVTVTYTGPINQGNVVVPITYTNNATDPHNGYNSVGNPYQATIDFIALYNSQTTLIENQYRALIPSTAGTFTYTNGVSNNLAVVSNTNGRYIAPGQGFYVIKKSGATGSLTFTEAHKAVSTTPARLLSIPNDQRLAVTQNSLSSVSSVSSPKKVLRLNLQNSLHTDETTLVLGDGYDSNFKVEDDATYMTGSSVSLSSYSADGKSLAVNFMPNVKMVSEVKLKVNASTSGPVKLNFTDLSATGNYIVTLKDNYTNTSTDISINSVYEFEIDKNVSASFGAERFELLFKAPPTLPISLNSFNAVPIEATAELKWETDMERNANYFELERSTDGKNFIKIVEVKAAGNSDAPLAYSFLDKNPLTGKNYYQLKQVNGDGKVSYSEIVSVIFESLKEKQKSVTLYPNPAVNVNEVNLKYTGNIFDNITVKVKDLTGREIKSISYNGLSSDGVIIQDISEWSSGLYIFELNDVKTNQSIITLKLIKQ